MAPNFSTCDKAPPPKKPLEVLSYTRQSFGYRMERKRKKPSVKVCVTEPIQVSYLQSSLLSEMCVRTKLQSR